MKKVTLLAIVLFMTSGYIFAQTPDSTSDFFNEEEFLDLDWESEGFTLTEVQEKSQQVRTVTKEDIEKSNASTITEVLQKKAGLNVKNYGGYGNTSAVYIRGMSGDAVAILVDGVQVNSAQSGEFDLSHLSLTDVEKIEIVKGGSDTKYNISGACGGVDCFDFSLCKEEKVRLITPLS